MSTPQNLALRDAIRGIDLFKKVNVPILGMIQNMSTFTCTNCGHNHDIFGLDGMKLLSRSSQKLADITTRCKAKMCRSWHSAARRYTTTSTDMCRR